MKRLSVALVVMGALAGWADSRLVRDYKDAQAAVSQLKRQSYEYSTANSALKDELRELKILCEVLAGRRKEAPQTTLSTNLVRVVVGDAAWECISPGGRNLNRVERLGLPDERTYLISAEIKAKEMTGPVKFGCYVPVRGSEVQWPGVDVGGGTFEWSRVSFVYRLPKGGQLAVCIGPNSNAGGVWFRNVNVYELVTGD